MPADPVRVALIQMACVPSTKRTSTTPRTSSARPRAPAQQLVCLPELFGAQYFCQREDHAPLRPGRAHPRPFDCTSFRSRTRSQDHADRRPCSSGAPPASTTTPSPCWTTNRPSRTTSSASTARCTSPTTRCSTRSSTSRPATWASAPSPPPWPHRRADLLGPVVPGGRAPDRAGGRAVDLHPHRHRLAPQREGRVRRSAVLRVEGHPARPRHRQRGLRLRRQPRRPRARRRDPRLASC